MRLVTHCASLSHHHTDSKMRPHHLQPCLPEAPELQMAHAPCVFWTHTSDPIGVNFRGVPLYTLAKTANIVLASVCYVSCR